MSTQPTILQPIIPQRIEAILKAISTLPISHQVTLVAVSKMQASDAIKVAYKAGIRHCGENYLQEALKKQSELSDLDIVWHFIGPIQSNKTQLIAQHFDWVESVDREKIAKRLSEARLESGKTPLSVCIQVNISHEESKSGVAEDDILGLAKIISQCQGLVLRGLMTIPDPMLDETDLRTQFRKMKIWFDQLQRLYPTVDTLSMGMTHDYLVAIAEGATLVRIGTGIFGVREKNK